MNSVARSVVVYFFMLLIFRISGKRTLAKITTFDLVLTLFISEAVQQALLDGDGSMTNGLLVVVTLVGIDIALSMVKHRWPAVRKLLEGQPVVLVQDGAMVKSALDKERVEADDVLASARERLGIARLADIRHAVLEDSGGISVVPRRTT